MSIKTTHLVTREFALVAIQTKLYEASDERLADILEEVLHNGFYNFQVVTNVEMEENKKEEFPIPMLTDLEYLPDSNDAY